MLNWQNVPAFILPKFRGLYIVLSIGENKSSQSF
nr:MAG TPA: hypothetical protein [Caudoviricetes sp.]